MSKKLKILIAFLLVITCIVAVIHKNSQEEISCLVIRQEDQDITVDFSDLNRVDFSGELTDGKGTVTAHTYRGILLKELLTEKGVIPAGIAVTSADNYTAEFTKEEVWDEQRVYAVIMVDGEAVEGIDSGTSGVQIIVFGDPNSRRCVRYASIINIQ